MMTSREDPGFLMVGMTEHTWKIYASWFTRRQTHPPPFVHDYLLVGDMQDEDSFGPRPRLLAGCCIYPCEGPFAVVEYAAMSPDAPPRLAHGAMLFGAQQLIEYGMIRKKGMLLFPSTKGMAKLLERAGFRRSKVPVMSWP
jgi:hypothetical protein